MAISGSQLAFQSATELSVRLRGGEVSAVELVEACAEQFDVSDQLEGAWLREFLSRAQHLSIAQVARAEALVDSCPTENYG